MPDFTQKHFNIIAKQFREAFPQDFASIHETTHGWERDRIMTQRGTLVAFALQLAKRFKEDNPRFDPIKFLNACSPDVDAYPLSEFWEDE
jgi:hypothetical protein